VAKRNITVIAPASSGLFPLRIAKFCLEGGFILINDSVNKKYK